MKKRRQKSNPVTAAGGYTVCTQVQLQQSRGFKEDVFGEIRTLGLFNKDAKLQKHRTTLCIV